MITVALAFLLQVQVQGQEQELIGPHRPTVYRWKDRAGQLHVTTTVPPSNANILEILPPDGAGQGNRDGSSLMTPEKFRTQMESVLAEKTIKYWHGIDKSFYDARKSKNADESIGTVNVVFKKTLWGDGLWAISLMPLVVVAICLLLAWWICASLSKRAKTLTWAISAFTSLIISHVCLHSALYRIQARRLDFMLSMIPNYIGGYVQVKPGNQKAIRDHVEALSKAASPLSLPWTFPVEIHRARKTLKRVVLDP